MVLYLVIYSISDVAAEKTERALIEGIEHFDTSKLKHTETQEKNPLPDKEGNYVVLLIILILFSSFLV